MPVLLITALGALLRFYAIGRQGLWYDESYTVFLVRQTPGGMLGLLPHLESTPPLYYCVAWVWTRIFGFGPAGIKSLSALTGTLTIPVAYAAARKLLPSRRAALIVALLTACNPFLVWYSQEARAYSMLVLLSACTLLAFAHARDRPRPRAVALWALSCALALTTHYYALIVVAPEVAWMLYEHRRSRGVWIGTGAIVLVGAALLPLALTQEATNNSHWIATSSYLLRLRQIPALFLLGPQIHDRTVVELIAFAMIAVAVGLLIWRTRPHERRGALLPGGIALAGLLLGAIPGHNTLLTRNLLPIWLPAAMFIAVGLGAARARLAGAAAAAVLCAIGIFGVLSVDTTTAYQRPNWQRVARALGPWPPARASGAGRVIVVQDNPGVLPLALYVPHLQYIKTPTLHDIGEVDVIAALPHHHLGGFCWWGSECNLVPSRLRRHYPLPGFHVVARRHVPDFGILVMRSNRPMTVSAAALPTTIRRHHRLRPGRSPLHDADLIQQA